MANQNWGDEMDSLAQTSSDESTNGDANGPNNTVTPEGAIGEVVDNVLLDNMEGNAEDQKENEATAAKHPDTTKRTRGRPKKSSVKSDDFDDEIKRTEDTDKKVLCKEIQALKKKT